MIGWGATGLSHTGGSAVPVGIAAFDMIPSSELFWQRDDSMLSRVDKPSERKGSHTPTINPSKPFRDHRSH